MKCDGDKNKINYSQAMEVARYVQRENSIISDAIWTYSNEIGLDTFEFPESHDETVMISQMAVDGRVFLISIALNIFLALWLILR